MKIERSKNAARNIVFSWIMQIYSLLIPFIIRTVMIRTLGIEYTGLNGLFTSILSVLNLAELGVGSALTFSMYRPIAEDDSEKICALMNLYKNYYRIIGLVILVIGLAVTPFIPKLIKSDTPDGINIYFLYLINLASTVITYWMFAYKNCLLTAHQRNDISSKVTMVVKTLLYTTQLVILCVFKSYYGYVTAIIVFGIIGNIATAVVVDKLFPQYHAKGLLPKQEIKVINRKVKDLFTSKIGSVILNSADTIVISSFLGLSTLAIYQNYYSILMIVDGFVTVIYGSCTAGIGNSLITESEEKNYDDLKTFLFIVSWISAFCSCCFATLYQPFMICWVGSENMLSYSYVICFCIFFYVRQINTLLNTFKDAAGIWHRDRFRPLVTALSNLVLNLILVNYIGLYGVLLSTVVTTTLIGMPWLIGNLFTEIFHKSVKSFLIKAFEYVLVAVISVAASLFVTKLLNVSSAPISIVINLIISLIIPNLLYLLLFYKSNEFKKTIGIFNTITKGKFEKLLNKTINKNGG